MRLSIHYLYICHPPAPSSLNLCCLLKPPSSNNTFVVPPPSSNPLYICITHSPHNFAHHHADLQSKSPHLQSYAKTQGFPSQPQQRTT